MTATMTTTTVTDASESVLISQSTPMLNRTSTSDASKAKSRYYIPRPATKIAERQWQLEQMAGAFRIFAKLGFADGGSGHISLRGKQPSCNFRFFKK